MNEHQQPLTKAVSIAAGVVALLHASALGSFEGLVSLGAAYVLVLGASHAVAGGERERPLADTPRPWENKLVAVGTVVVGIFGLWASVLAIVVWKNRAKLTGASPKTGGFGQFEERVAAMRDQARAEGRHDLAEKLRRVSQATAVIQQVTQPPAPVERPATAPLKAPTRNLEAPRPAKKAPTRALPPEPAPPVAEAIAPAPLDNWGLSTASATPASDLDRWGLTSSVSPTTTPSAYDYTDSLTQPATNGFDEALALLQGKKPDDPHR